MFRSSEDKIPPADTCIECGEPCDTPIDGYCQIRDDDRMAHLEAQADLADLDMYDKASAEWEEMQAERDDPINPMNGEPWRI